MEIVIRTSRSDALVAAVRALVSELMPAATVTVLPDKQPAIRIGATDAPGRWLTVVESSVDETLEPAALPPGIVSLTGDVDRLRQALHALLAAGALGDASEARQANGSGLVAGLVRRADLTARETFILTRLNQHLTIDQIARDLAVSRATVRAQLASATAKLGATDSAEACARLAALHRSHGTGRAAAGASPRERR